MHYTGFGGAQDELGFDQIVKFFLLVVWWAPCGVCWANTWCTGLSLGLMCIKSLSIGADNLMQANFA